MDGFNEEDLKKLKAQQTDLTIKLGVVLSIGLWVSKY